MGKRIFATLLLLSLLFAYCIAGSIEAAEAEDLGTVIARQIEEYAAALMGESMPSTGKNVLLRHAVFGGGKDLLADEDSPLTAALMNSTVLQECLRNSCANMIRNLLDGNFEILYAHGGLAWYHAYQLYHVNGYLNQQELGPDHMGDHLARICSASTRESDFRYGYSYLDASMNACDEALMDVVGSANWIMTVHRTGVRENTAVYNVSVTVFDNFDFDAEGHEGLDQELNEIGGSLAQGLIKSFHWESTVEFTLEVPYSCDHVNGNYEWTLDPQSKELIHETGEGLLVNAATPIDFVQGTVHHRYYQLRDPVRLLNDSPWVLEYDAQGTGYFSMGMLPTHSTAMPFFTIIPLTTQKAMLPSAAALRVLPMFMNTGVTRRKWHASRLRIGRIPTVMRMSPVKTEPI